MSDFKSREYQTAGPAKKEVVRSGTFENIQLQALAGGKATLSDEDRLQAELRAQRKELESILENAHQSLQALKQAVDSDRESFKQNMEHLAQEMTKMTILIAEQIINTELRTNPKVILKFVEMVLEEAEENKKRTIVMHPDDLQFLKDNCAKELSALETSEEVEIETDAALPRGDVRVFTPMSRVESGAYKKLALLWNRVTGMPMEEREEVVAASAADAESASEGSSQAAGADESKESSKAIDENTNSERNDEDHNEETIETDETEDK